MLEAFYKDFCPFIQQSLAELTKILGRVVYTGDCTTQLIPNMVYVVTVWRSCRLLHLGDNALLKVIKDYPSMVRCGPCRAHRWGNYRGAQDVIWYYCEKLPRQVPNHHQLGPYKPGTFDGSANDVAKACHLPGKVGIWTRHRRWNAANGPLSGSATSVPTPSGDDGGWKSTGASLWVYRHDNHGTKAGCWWLSSQP